jgi:putative nucleotidyltransferase with HDIG domain
MSYHGIDSKSARKTLVDDIISGSVRSIAKHPALREWPEFVALKSTEQDPEWHAEGDVLTHTDMVLAECAKVETALESESDRQVLRAAALFHDIAKSRTTRYDPDVGHIIARGHERMGAVQTRYCLHGSSLTHTQRRQVASLVGTHHLVKRSVAQMNSVESTAALERLASQVDTRLLWALELADMRGRICIDQAKQVEQVELFALLCEERGVFGQEPTPWLDDIALDGMRFASNLSRQWVLRETHRQRLTGQMTDRWQALAFAHEHRESEHPQVIVPIGVSGSGKSTTIAELGPEWERVSPDLTRERLYGSAEVQGDGSEVYRLCREQLQSVLRRKGRAVFDATNVIADYREKIVTLCLDYSAYVSYWIFDISRECAIERNRKRERRVPESVIDGQINRFGWPNPDEAHEVQIFDEYR